MSRDVPDPTPEEVKYVLQQAILRNYPNPDRKGCPGSPALKRAAVQQRPFENPDWEHTSHCSPCYREFLDYRHGVLDQHARAKTSARIAVGAVVASFIIAAAVFGVVRNRAPLPPAPIADHTPSPTPTPPQPTPQPEPQIVAAVLNLESQSATRSVPEAGNPAVTGDLQRIPRGRLSLSIYLPLGSQAGSYEIQLLKNESDSTPLGAFAGSAQIENGLTVLRISPNFSAVDPGTYILAIRHEKESWRYYRFFLS